MSASYLFRSERLGFRNWNQKDLPLLVKLNNDPRVMEYFPSTLSETDSRQFLYKMQKMFDNKGYCYFAVDLIDTGKFIGFIGLCDQEYESPFTPCVDIGWRISPEYWGYGYATEGARKCLEYGFNNLGVKSIISVAPAVNQRSVRIMEKIGMTKKGSFEHPKLLNDDRLRNCVYFELCQ